MWQQETNVFYPWKHCLPLLEKNDHASFSRPESSGSSSPSSPSTPIAAPSSPFSPSPSGTSTYEDDEEEEEENEKWPIPPPLGCLNPTTLPKELLVETSLLEGNTLVPLLVRFFLYSSRDFPLHIFLPHDTHSSLPL